MLRWSLMYRVFIRDQHLWKGGEGGGISLRENGQTTMQTNSSPMEGFGAEMAHQSGLRLG